MKRVVHRGGDKEQQVATEQWQSRSDNKGERRRKKVGELTSRHILPLRICRMLTQVLKQNPSTIQTILWFPKKGRQTR